MSNKTYTLLCNGRRYDRVTADEAKRLLIVGGYSYHYVDQLVRDTLPTIEEADVADEVAECLLRANKLCERAEATIETIREVSNDLDKEFKQWCSSKKSSLAQKAGDTSAESRKPSSPKANTVAERRRVPVRASLKERRKHYRQSPRDYDTRRVSRTQSGL